MNPRRRALFLTCLALLLGAGAAHLSRSARVETGPALRPAVEHRGARAGPAGKAGAPEPVFAGALGVPAGEAEQARGEQGEAAREPLARGLVLEVVLRPRGSPQGPFEVVLERDHVFAGRRYGWPKSARFDELEPGLATVRVMRHGWFPAQAELVLAPAGARARLEIEPEPLRSIVGTALAEEDGSPLPAFSVLLEGRGERRLSPSTEATFETPDGAFRMAEENEGVVAHRVTLSAPGRIPASSEWIDVWDYPLVVPPIALLLEDGCTLRGTVLSSAGTPLAGASVAFAPGKAPPSIRVSGGEVTVRASEASGELERLLVAPGGAPSLRKTTAEDGSFRFALPCGVAGQFVAWGPGHVALVTDTETVVAGAHEPRTLWLEPDAPVLLRVHAGAHALGTIELQRVDVLQPPRHVQASAIETGPAGAELRLYEARVHPGEGGHARVLGRRTGQARSSRPELLASADFGPGQAREIDLYLDSGPGRATLLARLELPPEVLAKTVRVGLLASGAKEPSVLGFLDDSGVLELSVDMAGRQVLAVVADQGAGLVWQREVVLERGERLDLGELDLRALGRVRASGVPPGQWRVAREAGPISPVADYLLVQTDEADDLVLFGLEQGAYTVDTRHEFTNYVDPRYSRVYPFVRGSGPDEETQLEAR